MVGTNHPCFNPSAANHAIRIHLPVAASCNIQCAFCNRNYDCVNESRPGVTSALLTPKQAVRYLEKLEQKLGNFEVVGIAGPGDPFAEPDVTLETLQLVRQRYPHVLLCTASNGLNVADFAPQIATVGVSHMSITVNAVDPQIGASIVSWVRYQRKMYRGVEAAELLLERQKHAISSLRAHGVTVKVNTIVIPGINTDHVREIAQSVSLLGANVHNCMPFLPVEGTDLADTPRPDHETMQKVRWESSRFLAGVKHCARCRSDAAGLLGKENGDDISSLIRECAALPMDPADDRPHVAVASREGMLVNEHLGRSERFYIFTRKESRYELIAERPAPTSGLGLQRWRELAELLSDCRALLVYQAGDTPMGVLADAGIRVLTTEGLAEEAVAAVYEGRALSAATPVRMCSGPASGQGCG